MINEIKNNYSKKHEFVSVNEDQFRRLDLKFYNSIQRKLEILGFEKLGDVEDLALKEMKPGTFMRLMKNSSSTITAAIFHVKPVFWRRVLMIFDHYGPLKIYEFETEFSDGRFLTSSIVSPKDIFTNTPDIFRQFCLSNENVQDVYKKHLEKIEEIKQNYSVVEVKNETIEKVCGSQNRQIERERGYRESVGWIRREDLEKWTNDNELSKLVYQEIEKIVSQEKISV